MYIIALLMTFAMATIGISGLEMAMSYQHSQTRIQATHIATNYMSQVEEQYLAKVAQWEQGLTPDWNGTVNSTTPDKTCYSSSGQTTSANRSVNGANGTQCNFFGIYTASFGSDSLATASSGPITTSTNVNDNANEVRATVILKVDIQDAQGVSLAKKTRTITIRTYQTEPFVSVINSQDTQATFAGKQGVVGSVGTASADGDVAGCDGNTSVCGDSTLIRSYSACANGGSGNPARDQMLLGWCNNRNSSTLAADQANGNYNATGNNPTGVWGAVDTTTYQNKTWNNNTNGSNSGN